MASPSGKRAVPGQLAPSSRPSISAERLEWLKEIRLNFCPQGSINTDGSINQEFFKPKKVVLVEDKKWGNDEREALYKGLEKYGVGKWREISEELLPKWDEQAIRIKASRLLGTQSLARHAGWKGNKQAVEAEYAKHKQIGMETGCWKQGVLVENDAGDVQAALAAWQ